MTALIHASRLRSRFATNFFTTDRFLEDAAKGDLPTYSFIEPNFLHGHNDMHPAFNAMAPGMNFDPPSSILGGEALLAKIYNAVRASSSPNGSNVYNTLLMVNFDEHGGTYDHVVPPAAPPPNPSAPAGQMGFTFDRSGIRVPAIAISPWIPARTVITDEYRHTSVIRTLRERWSLGAPLTGRDASARDIAPILSLDTPRLPDEWPDAIALPVPTFDVALLPDAPLGPLPKAIFEACLGLGKALGQPMLANSLDPNIKGNEAVAIVREMFMQVFPGLKA
jgi:phospholipase C